MKKSTLTRLLLRVSNVIILPDLRFANHKRNKTVLGKKQIRFLYSPFLQMAIWVLIFSNGYGQEGKKFKARYTNQSIKGNLVLIGNTQLGVTRTDAVMVAGSPIPANLAVLTAQANSNAVYTNQANGGPWKIDPDLDGEDKEDGLANNRKSMEYIDIDNDNTTFASSSAELHIESPCKKIIYAGLYWQAVYINDRSRKFNPHNENNYSGTKRLEDWDKIKFKRPWDTGYQDITADEIIFDGLNETNIRESFRNAPYLCYADVTNRLKEFGDPNGNYFVANIKATKGRRTLGSTSGWTLVIVYEDITQPSKKIVTFDGFVGVQRDSDQGQLSELNFTVDGFITPAGPEPVKATIGIVSQEGELAYQGDYLNIKTIDNNGKPVFKSIFNELNDVRNVFNSSITIPSAPLFTDNPVIPGAEYVIKRSPSRLNTFGFDMDLININKGYLRNGQTSLDIQLTSSGDAYAVSLVTLAIDIVQPNIVIKQTVTNENNVEVQDNEVVNLGEYLKYKITFSNNGDDNAREVLIKDVLPKNIIFNYPEDLIHLPTGVTVSSVVNYDADGNQISGYNPETRTIIFEVADNLVNIGGAPSVIEFRVKIVSCISLDSDPNFEQSCDLTITNEVSTSFIGVVNQTRFNGDSGLIYNCENIDAKTTNILSNLLFCDKQSEAVLCPPNTVLKATNGFESYNWSRNPTGVPVFQSGQTITVNDLGTYYVVCTPFANPLPHQACATLKEIIEVKPFIMSNLDPLGGAYGEKTICAADNTKQLTNFYLCPDSPVINIDLNIPQGVSSILWEKSNCAPIEGATCPDESVTCQWDNLNNNDNRNYAISSEGQYRVILNYGINCSAPYYFNVYKEITPTATSEDIFCQTPGTITVTKPAMGSGYEYSLDKINYQTDSKLSVKTAGTYTVYIRPVSSNKAKCSYEIPDIKIEYKDLNITHKISNSALNCFDDTASVEVTANNVRSDYVFTIYYGNQLLKTSGTIAAATYTFDNLKAGDYNVLVTTTDGCEANDPFIITSPKVLTASTEITRVLTCKPAEITVTAVGGTPPYTFTVLGSNANGEQYQKSYSGSSPMTIVIPSYTSAMDYRFYVIDANNCKEVYAGLYRYKPLEALTLKINSSKDIKCKGNLTGEISAEAKGGLGNYIFTLSDKEGFPLPFTPTQTTPGNFTQLPAGLYQVSVTSQDCGPVVVPIEIKEPKFPLTHQIKYDNVTCAGLANVTIEVIATGGTGKIRYAISSLPNQFFDTGIFSRIKAGTYTITIKDENDCRINDVITIIDPKPLQASVVQGSIQQEICIGEKTAAFSIEISGGVSPYKTSLDNRYGTYTTDQTDFSKLSGGKHTVYILDKNNCPFELAILLDIPTIVLKPTAKVSYNCDNNTPGNKVTVTIDPSNTNPSLIKYSLDGKEPKQNSTIFSNVPAGNHFVKAEHTNGCSEVSPMFAVEESSPPLTVSLSQGGLNEIIITIKGGSGFYNSVTINNEVLKFTYKYIYYKSGDYTVTVVDSNGCTATATKYFEFIDIIIPNIFTPNDSGINDGWKPLRQDNYPDIRIRIYDRYGREICVLKHEESWDGKYENANLPTGDYWYVLKLRNTRDDREFIGNVTLYR